MLWRWESRRPAENAAMSVLHRIKDELRDMDDLTKSSLTVLLTSILFIAAARSFFSWRLSKKFAKMDALQKSLDDREYANMVRFVFMLQFLDNQRRLVESMNMALYMSEMRKKGKTQRPRRPPEVELRVPKFLPALKAERCEKDGVAVLEIKDDDLPEKTKPETADGEVGDNNLRREPLLAEEAVPS